MTDSNDISYDDLMQIVQMMIRCVLYLTLPAILVQQVEAFLVVTTAATAEAAPIPPRSMTEKRTMKKGYDGQTKLQ